MYESRARIEVPIRKMIQNFETFFFYQNQISAAEVFILYV